MRGPLLIVLSAILVLAAFNSNSGDVKTAAASPPWAKTVEQEYYPGLTNGLPLADGGLLAVGEIGYPVNYDGWIVQIDSGGKFKSQVRYNCQKSDRFQAVCPAADGGYFAAGRTNFDGTSEKGGDGWLVKLDKNLKVSWSKRYDLSWYRDDIQLLMPLDSGSVLAAGWFRSAHGDLGTFVMKLNSSGAVIWSDLYSDFYARALLRTSDGNALIIGFDDLANGGLIKIDSQGIIKWAKTYDGPSFDWDDELFYSGCNAGGGDMLIAGKIEASEDTYSCLIMKINRNGKIKWQNGFNLSNWTIRSVFPAQKGGFFFAGPPHYDSPIIFLGKITAAGQPVFLKGYEPFNTMKLDSVDQAFLSSEGAVYMLCSYVTDNPIIKFDGTGKTDSKCALKPTSFKLFKTRLAASVLELNPAKVRPVVKTIRTSQQTTRAVLEDACR